MKPENLDLMQSLRSLLIKEGKLVLVRYLLFLCNNGFVLYYSANIQDLEFIYKLHIFVFRL